MDINIDLRDENYKSREKRKIHNTISIMLLAVFFMLFVFHLYKLHLANEEKLILLDDYIKENIVLKKELEDIDDMNKDTFLLESERESVVLVEDNAVLWSKKLAELSQVTPENLIVVAYKSNSEKEVFVEGTSKSINDIAVFKEGLNNRSSYNSVLINSIESDANKALYYFKIDTKLGSETIEF